MPKAERLNFKELHANDPEHAKVLEWLRNAENSTPETTYREESIEDYKFYAGDQDDENVLAKLKEEKRPNPVFNEVKPKVDMLVGLAAQTKHDPNVLPVGMEDEPLAEIAQHALKHFHRKLKISDKEIDCFDHTVQSGRSLLHFYIDTSNPFKPQIKCQRFAGNNFYLDPEGTEMDGSDHRFRFIEKYLTEEEIKVFWPDVDINQIANFGKRFGTDFSFFNEASEKYRIVECWYKKYVKVKYFINPMTGKDEYLTPAEFNKFVVAIQEGIRDPETDEVIFQDESGVTGINSVVQEIWYMIFTADIKLEGGKSPFRWKDFPNVVFAAYKDTDKNNWFSAIKAMKDPQDAHNTMYRQLMHLIQTLPKGLLKHEVGSILNIEEYEEGSSRPNFHLEIAKGQFDKVGFEKQPPISPVYQYLISAFSQSIKNASGIQDSMMAISEGTREAGVTRRMKLETGIAVLFRLYDNFRKARLRVSELMLSLIQQYITDTTVIRIEGEQGAQLAEINSQMNPQVEGFNDITAAEFDLVVDESVENATIRLTIAQILTEFSHNNPGSIPPDIILEYSDMPYTVKQRVKAFYQQMQEQEQANKEREFELKEREIAAKIGVAQIGSEAKEETETKREEK
jgi:hypothetical protein